MNNVSLQLVINTSKKYSFSQEYTPKNPYLFQENTYLSHENNIAKLYKEVEKHTIVAFSNFMNNSAYEESKEGILEQFRERLHLINKTFWVTKEKFKYTKRDSWEMYFSHVSWVLRIYLNKFSTVQSSLDKLDNNNIDDILIALELIKSEVTIAATCLDHDSIEDTDVTYEWLKETSGEMIAFSTLLLSKTPFNKYIVDIADLNEFEEIKKTWVLNTKWLLSDIIKRKIYIEKYINHPLVKYSITDNFEITEQERNWIQRFKTLAKKYKEIKNNDFFEHMKSREKLEEYAKKLMVEKWITFSEQDFNTVIQNVIIVKLSDRIQNLEDIATSWADDPLKIENKLVETESSLLPLAKDINTDIYEYMKSEIFRIRNLIIYNTTLNNVNIAMC